MIIEGISFFRRNRVQLTIACLFLALGSNVGADTTWINLSDGFWHEPLNWSQGLPSQGQGVTSITNENTKTVTVDVATPSTNLIVQRLTLSAPAGSTNTLLLMNVPFSLKNTFAISDGGLLRVSNSTLRIDGVTGGSFNINAGSTLLEGGLLETTNNAVTSIGRVGTGSLEMNAGTARLDEVLVGRFAGSQGALTIRGGSMTIRANFDIADDLGSQGIVTVLGGELTATNVNATTRIGDDGDGQMIVSNGLVRLDDVSVARHLTGQLTVAGGTMLTGDISIGRLNGATGQVLVVGGQLLLPTDSILIGREGAGSMTVAGGEVQAAQVAVAPTNTSQGLLTLTAGIMALSSNLVVGSPVSSGQVFLAGGNLFITNETATGTWDVQSGTVTLDGGTVTIDQLLVTNASGQFAFNRGTLNSAGTTVSNASPFIVGDGTNSATFHLLGGIHFFADGLIISSNASLTGCGTVIGSIANYGIIATNCAVAPIITSINKTGTTVSLSFTTVTGQSYTVEYKNTVNDANWTALLPALSGTGNIMTKTDTSATSPTRFYRVRTE